MGARVAEVELAVGHAHEKFDDDGRLVDDDVRGRAPRGARRRSLAESSPAAVAA